MTLKRFYKKGIVPPKECKQCGNLFYRTLNIEAKNWKRQTTCSKKCRGIWQNKILCYRFARKFGKKPCDKCKILFQPKNQNHRFCGSKKYKIGCSWEMEIKRKQIANSKYRMYGARKYWLNTTKIISH